MPSTVSRSVAVAFALAVAASAAPSSAQQSGADGPVDARRVELAERMAKAMGGLARSAASQKANSLAREIAAIVVAHYDADHAGARRVLGHKKVAGGWQESRGGGGGEGDGARARTLERLKDKWAALKEEAGGLHRDLALQLKAEGVPAAGTRAELELALSFLPDDPRVHAALGHEEFDGFWGTAADVALAKRLRAIVDRAAELRAQEVDVAEVDAAELPVELRQTGLPMFGARSENYTWWSSDSFEAAARCARWAERAHMLLRFVLADKADEVRGEKWKWHCVLRTEAERDVLLTKSPTTRGPFPLDQAQLFAGIGFRAEAGGRASATWQGEALDADYAIACVTKRHLIDMRNEALGEGLVHVMTWLLNGTVSTYFADLPTTVAGGFVPMKRDPDEWFPRLWKEIDERRDQPVVVVPRERMDNFRDSTRLKAWSFQFWLLGSYPDRWLPLIDELTVEKLTPEAVEAGFEEVFGKPAAELEVEWRRWARRGSAVGKASGFRPKG